MEEAHGFSVTRWACFIGNINNLILKIMKNPNQKHFQPMFDSIVKKNKAAAEKKETSNNGELSELRNEIAEQRNEIAEQRNEIAEQRNEIELLKAEIKKLKK